MARTKHGHFINGSGNYQEQPAVVVKCGGTTVCSECRDEQQAFYDKVGESE